MPTYETISDKQTELIDKLIKDISALEKKNFDYMVEIESLKQTINDLRNIAASNNLKTFGL